MLYTELYSHMQFHPALPMDVPCLFACFEKHEWAITWANGQSLYWLDSLTWSQLQLIPLGNHRYQDLCLHECKVVPDTDVGASSKWEISTAYAFTGMIR